MAKVRGKQSQIKTILQFLQKRVATASMVSKETGIPHKNITRYKRDLEQAGKLAEVRKGICPITRFKAWFITCDESLFPSRNQLKLF